MDVYSYNNAISKMACQRDEGSTSGKITKGDIVIAYDSVKFAVLDRGVLFFQADFAKEVKNEAA